MTSPEVTNQDWKAQIIRGRNGSVILPEEFRVSLRYAVNVLGLDQLGIARGVHISQGLVSNLFTGKKPIRDRHIVNGIVALMEQKVIDASTGGTLDAEKRKEMEEIIRNLRDVFNPRLPVTTLRTIDPNWIDLILDSLSLVIKQSAKFNEHVNFAMQNSPQSQDQILAALRMSQLFNEAAQVILKEQGNIIIKNPQDGVIEKRRRFLKEDEIGRGVENIALETEQRPDLRSQTMSQTRRVRKWIGGEEIVRRASAEENDILPQYFSQ